MAIPSFCISSTTSSTFPLLTLYKTFPTILSHWNTPAKPFLHFYQKTRPHASLVNNTFIRNTWLRYLINEKQYLPNPPLPSRHFHFTKSSWYLIYGIWDISAFPHFVKIWCKSGENIFCDLGWVAKWVMALWSKPTAHSVRCRDPTPLSHLWAKNR